MILFVLIGFTAGIVSGMGIGGGTILIPALCILLDMQQQEAQNINLLYFIPTAIIALITHTKEKNVEKNIALKLAIYGILSAAIGSYIAIKTQPEVLGKMFGFFLLGMGMMEFFRKDSQITKHEHENTT